MGPAKGAGLHQAMSTTSLSKLQKQTLANGPLPRSARLYRQSRTSAHLSNHKPASDAVTATRFGFHPDDTTPIPRPSNYVPPLSQQLVSPPQHRPRRLRQVDRRPLSGKIDKSVLPSPNPNDAAINPISASSLLSRVLFADGAPSDPHHLRFAQPRALGVKVSDEFTVPLCRGHHRQLHQAGDEIAWWKTFNLEALMVARQLWGPARRESGTAD